MSAVRVVLPLILPEVAEMIAIPMLAVLTKPVALTVATLGSELAQVTLEVILDVVLSDLVPVAVNCLVSPAATVGLVGVTAIETSSAAVTVNVVLFQMVPPREAFMVVVPAVRPVARPPEPEVTVATASLELVQVA